MKIPVIAMAVAIIIVAGIAFFMISQGGSGAQSDIYALGEAPAAAMINASAANATSWTAVNSSFSSQGYSVSIGTAKYELLEKEETLLMINVTSPVSTPAEIKYSGLKNNMGRWRVKDSFDADLVQGQNSLSVNISMPACSKCSGLEEGVQQINAAVYVHGDLVANASATIMFLKRDDDAATLRND